MINYNYLFFKFFLRIKSLFLKNFHYWKIKFNYFLEIIINLKIKILEFFYFKFINVLKKNKIKKFIQKGKKKLGVYFTNLNKKKSYFSLNNLLFFSWIIIVKRKNLFLTFLNLNGDVLFKSNLGSNGFKKRVKFTGYAIRRSCLNFSRKIQYYIQKYKKQFSLKFNSILSRNKVILKKVLKKLKIIHLKKTNKIFLNKLFKFNKKYKKPKLIFKNWDKMAKLAMIYQLNNIIINNKLNIKKENISYKYVIRYILRNKKYIYIKKYRNYDFYKYRNWFKKKKILIKIELRSEIFHWGFRFIFEGFKSFFKKVGCITYIENCQRIPHSKGLRIKKKRRI